MNNKLYQLKESLAELEHQQWMAWARDLLEKENISNEIRDRWEVYFVPYAELPEKIKERDRVYAQKSLDIMKKYTEIN